MISGFGRSQIPRKRQRVRKKRRKSNPLPKCARGFEKTLRKFEPSAENAQNLEPFVRQKKVHLQAARRCARPPDVRENEQNQEPLAKMRQRVRKNAQNFEPSATLCLATKGTGFLVLRASQRQTVRKFVAAPHRAATCNPRMHILEKRAD